jgi:hypothetical protein
VLTINTEYPRRPKAHSKAICQRKLDAALAVDPDLRCRINNAVSDWRAKQQQAGGSIVMDDGNPPTRPTANTVRYMLQVSEHNVLEDEQRNDNTTQDDLVDTKTITKTIADDGSKPEDDLYTAVSIGEDIDKLSI